MYKRISKREKELNDKLEQHKKNQHRLQALNSEYTITIENNKEKLRLLDEMKDSVVDMLNNQVKTNELLQHDLDESRQQTALLAQQVEEAKATKELAQQELRSQKV